MSADVDVDKILLCRGCDESRRMKDSFPDPTKDDSKVDYGATSEGFAEDEELFENTQIRIIRIDSQTSTTRVSILIERTNGATGTTTASVELKNLAEYDVRDKYYTESTGMLYYSELSEEIQERVKALLDYPIRSELGDITEDEDEGESGSDLLRRE